MPEAQGQIQVCSDSEAMEARLSATESLCPRCLRRIPAVPVRTGDDVYLVKTCPEHGDFRSVIWRGPPDYESWYETKPAHRPGTQTATERGCPFDCGLCPEHLQQTCCVLLEVTSRCDLGCPVCFASSGKNPGIETGSGPGSDPGLDAGLGRGLDPGGDPRLDREADPGLEEIEGWLRLLKAEVGACNIQLSGGEPTLRDDLPEILVMGRRMGFSFIQLNTNGLRLALEAGYAGRLADAGLSTVFLQFDGLGDDVYRRLRGQPLLEKKQAAIAACAAAGLGVVLVPTLVPGVNTGQIGAIIDYALRWAPHVRGVHFQPVSYFGRYPGTPGDGDRYTLPELMRAIETQTEGRFPAAALRSSGCGHSLCSFSGDFLVMADGSVRPLSDPAVPRVCCGGEGPTRAIDKQRDFIARRWSAGAGQSGPARGASSGRGSTGTIEHCARTDGSADPVMSLDDFLERVRSHAFTITAMAFQDAWTLDLERLRHCHLHVVAPTGKIVPFCAYNLTDMAGNPLFRGVAARRTGEVLQPTPPTGSWIPLLGGTS